MDQPERIGRYEVIDHLGSGAMADIYRVRDPEINRTVAIKVLKDMLQDDTDLERFTREARAAGALTHPNIVTIHDVGRFEERPYITMELVEGPTLEDLMLGGRTHERPPDHRDRHGAGTRARLRTQKQCRAP